ncbi:hypothetical protein ACLBYE_20805, partial [Methylobacterium sp. A52T]
AAPAPPPAAPPSPTPPPPAPPGPAPVGQAAGTRVVAALAPRLAGLAEAAATADLDALGAATFRLDLGSFRHETQYSRIFRS